MRCEVDVRLVDDERRGGMSIGHRYQLPWVEQRSCRIVWIGDDDQSTCAERRVDLLDGGNLFARHSESAPGKRLEVIGVRG